MRWHEHVVLSGRTADADLELLARDGDQIQLRTTSHGGALRTMGRLPTTQETVRRAAVGP